MSVAAILIIAGGMLALGLLLGWIAWEVDEHNKFIARCRQEDEKFVHQEPRIEL